MGNSITLASTIDRGGLPRDSGAVAHGSRLSVAAEALVPIGTWEYELATGRTFWSNELYRIHGFEPGDVEPSIDLLIELAHGEDRRHVSRVLSEIVERRTAMVDKEITLEYRVLRFDGSVGEIRMRGRTAPDQHGASAWWVGSALDVTNLRLTERELHAHAAVDASLRDWASSEEDVSDLLRRLGIALKVGLGSMWTSHPGRKGLCRRAFWSAPEVEGDEFEAATRAVTLRPGEGVAGQAWQRREPVFSEDLATDPRFAHRQLAAKLGLQSGLAFAVVSEDETLAVLDYYSLDRQVPNTRLFGTLGGIGRELGRFFSHRRAELGSCQLTPRELEVLRLAAEGTTGPAIAERLFISPSTVKSHFENIYVKLGVRDRSAAVARGLRVGLIS